MTKRSDPEVRTAELLTVALNLAAADGWHALTREKIANAAGVSPGLVSVRLGTMDALKRSVMRAAVTRRVVAVVAEGLVAGDRHARKADAGLRDQCKAWMDRA